MSSSRLAFSTLWDSRHPFPAGESAAQAYAALAPRILPGRAGVPVRGMPALLAALPQHLTVLGAGPDGRHPDAARQEAH